jgi:hypothetical protein
MSHKKEVNILIGCQMHFPIILRIALLLVLPALLTKATVRADNKVPISLVQSVPVTIDGETVHLQMLIYMWRQGGRRQERQGGRILIINY